LGNALSQLQPLLIAVVDFLTGATEVSDTDSGAFLSREDPQGSCQRTAGFCEFLYSWQVANVVRCFRAIPGTGTAQKLNFSNTPSQINMDGLNIAFCSAMFGKSISILIDNLNNLRTVTSAGNPPILTAKDPPDVKVSPNAPDGTNVHQPRFVTVFDPNVVTNHYEAVLIE